MGIKLKFKPLFILYVFLCIYFNWFNKVFYYVVTVTIHEFAHYLVAKKYGYQMDSIDFSISGAGLSGNNNFKPKDEIKIATAGPLINLILIVITIAMFWIFPLSYLYTYGFLICNLSVMIFNLLPIYPLDGGRIIVSLLTIKNKDKTKIIKFGKILGIILSAVLLILFVVSLFYKVNYNLLIISMFLAMCSISSDKNRYLDKVSVLNKKYDKPIEVKVFKLSNYDKMQMLKQLNPHYYSIFKVTDNEGNEIEIEENDLLKQWNF